MFESKTNIQTISPTSCEYIQVIDNTVYEVQSNYIGEIDFIDLLKKMIKRDIDKMNL